MLSIPEGGRTLILDPAFVAQVLVKVHHQRMEDYFISELHDGYIEGEEVVVRTRQVELEWLLPQGPGYGGETAAQAAERANEELAQEWSTIPTMVSNPPAGQVLISPGETEYWAKRWLLLRIVARSAPRRALQRNNSIVFNRDQMRLLDKLRRESTVLRHRAHCEGRFPRHCMNDRIALREWRDLWIAEQTRDVASCNQRMLEYVYRCTTGSAFDVEGLFHPEL